jgi:O-antigen ligase
MIVCSGQSLPRLRKLTIVLVLATMYLIGQGFAAIYWNYRPDILLYRGYGTIMPRVRAVGWLADPNDLAQQLVVVMALVIIAWRKHRLANNLVFVVLPLAILIYGVYLTQSRGGLLAIMALIFFTTRDRVNAFGATLMSTVAFIVMLGVSFGGGRAISLGGGGARLMIWGDGLTMFKDNPLFGIGYARFTHWSHYTAHNSFVQVLAEMGLVGSFFWVGLLVFSLGELTRLIGFPVKDADDHDLRAWAKGIRAAIGTFLVSGWFLSRAYTPMLYILIAMAVVVCEVYRKRHPELASLTRVPVDRWLRWTGVIEVGAIILVWVMLRARAF